MKPFEDGAIRSISEIKECLCLPSPGGVCRESIASPGIIDSTSGPEKSRRRHFEENPGKWI